jgi:secreted trypsin-like serine protease
MTARFILVAAVAVCLTGGTINPLVDDGKHVEYGDKFVHVARIRCEGEKTDDNPTGVCMASCVIISPRHILTAAHVVRNTERWTITATDGKARTLDRVVPHPKYGHGNGSNDIAIGRLREPIAMDWYPAIYAGGDESGKTVAIAGYGMRGNFRDGITGSDSKRRAGSNIVDSATGDYLICSISGPPWTTLEFLICAGDSGGGLFLGNELAGINSCIMAEGRTPTATYGEESVHVRLSVHRDWIREEMNRE